MPFPRLTSSGNRTRSALLATMLLATTLLSFPASAAADADLPGPFTAPSLAPPAPGDADFLKGTWTMSLFAGYNRECSSDPQMGYGGIGVGHYIMDYFAVNA